MIDLKRRGLPNAIYGNLGEPVKLNTDYRVWLTFSDRIEKAADGDTKSYTELFEDDAPLLTEYILAQLQAFYYEKPEIPRESKKGGPELIDYDIDADYIYAAFMQSYGIDLVEADLHWHKFLALVMALPEDTMMAKIMGYRGYDGKSKDPGYEDYIELKYVWALPEKRTEEEQKAIDEFNEMFG